MAKNLMNKIRKSRVAVPMRFKETVKDRNGRDIERFNTYPVYMKPSEARHVNRTATLEECYSTVV